MGERSRIRDEKRVLWLLTMIGLLPEDHPVRQQAMPALVGLATCRSDRPAPPNREEEEPEVA
jgi:hypothetical protein